MKKIFIPFLLAILFSCSSDSDSNGTQANTYEQELAGSWTASFCEADDATSCADQNLVLNLDGTGSVANVWNDGETYSSDLEWSATSSTITVTTLNDNNTDLASYVLNDNEMTITTTDNQVIIYSRL
jgi:hypothetical protein